MGLLKTRRLRQALYEKGPSSKRQAERKTKTVCQCENCGNEAEMVVTFNRAGANNPAVKKKRGSVEGRCAICYGRIKACE